MKRTTELKNLANAAKQRLKSGNYSQEVIKNAERNKAKASDYFYQNALALKREKFIAKFVTITNDYDDAFIKKVYAMLDANDLLCNPIGRLVDKKYFDALNEFEKQHYILTLCEKYNRIKEEYFETYTKIS